MLQKYLTVTATLLALTGVCFAGTNYVVPTTTLSAQTANNTSAASSFAIQTNGNRGAGNISKVDVHSLLYSGATTKIYAHLMVWFGQSNHMNIGYSSTDPTQVTNQINDMISRGIDGVIIDWYGPNNSKDQATQLVMAEAEKHPGFTFAIMVDQGAIKDYSCSGCSSQQALTSIMQYAEQTYFSSSAYMTNNGQPVVTNFDIDLSYSIDWNALNASLSTHPLFLFQNNSGFTHVLSDGSYSWVMPTTTDYGMSYLTSFYDTGMKYPGLQTVGATYKGFNDSLAAWGSGRIMGQQCGQTWLQTFSEINSLYNSGKQLSDLQLVTWNDYEEATELESGIDNCFLLSASVASNSLQWTIKGNENTVDHYTVYISTDGQNLMPLADNVPGNRSLNLCGFPIPSGSYQLLVQAVGKPSMANTISGGLNYSPACGSGGGSSTSTVTFSASPTAVTIPAGQSATVTVTANPQSGSFNSPITLACSGVPSGWQCAFSPAIITPGKGAATSTLTISAVAVARMSLPQRGNSIPIHGAWLLPIGMIGFVFAGGANRRRHAQTLSLFAVLGLGIFSASCGGGVSSKVQTATVPTSNNYTVTIVGSSTPIQLSTTVNIVVQ
jgi:hypothetical protein